MTLKPLQTFRPLLGALCLLFAGCMTVAIHGDDRHVKGAFYQGSPAATQASIEQRGKDNVSLWEESYKNERDYYLNPTKDGDKSYPRVCLSFSGGGIRSAAFSIGVMKGLRSLKGKDGAPFLHQIDIMSGASGGAYALTWYYVNQMDPKPIGRDELFAPPSQAIPPGERRFYFPPHDWYGCIQQRSLDSVESVCQRAIRLASEYQFSRHNCL
jgi:hypothetical protein